MQKALEYIKEELSGFYPESEIHSFYYLILQHICKKDKYILLRDKDNHLSTKENSQLKEFISELKKFKPIQYILGNTIFYNLSFSVNQNVLIPRPETEELVEIILDSTPNSPLKILDIGAGSGCIAISLAKHLPLASVSAIDISEKALEIAKKNATVNKVNVQFFQEDILNPSQNSIIKSKTWDIIVSNPPYIIPSEKASMSKNVLDFEPTEALFVPEDQPLLFYEAIATLGLHCLNDKGRLFFETSSVFGKATAEMLAEKGYNSISLHQDISGKDRIIEAALL